jgi:cytochrome c2
LRQAVVPGNVMPYAGMPDPQQRATLIEYLATLK